jgi:hypothetical protein
MQDNGTTDTILMPVRAILFGDSSPHMDSHATLLAPQIATLPRATSSAALAVDQSRSEALTGIMGARRACTVSMISPLSMPWR